MSHFRYRQMKIDNGGKEARRKMHTLLDALHQLLQVSDLQLTCTRGSQLSRARLYCLTGFEHLVDCHIPWLEGQGNDFASFFKIGWRNERATIVAPAHNEQTGQF